MREGAGDDCGKGCGLNFIHQGQSGDRWQECVQNNLVSDDREYGGGSQEQAVAKLLGADQKRGHRQQESGEGTDQRLDEGPPRIVALEAYGGTEGRVAAGVAH